MFVYIFVVQKRGTALSFWVGYGIIIPIAIQIPYAMIILLDVQNKFMAQCCSVPANVVVFRTLEAMYGTSPPVVESSLTNYINYYSSFVHAQWSDKTKSRVKIEKSEVVANLMRCIVILNFSSLMLSVLLHYDFELFQSRVKLEEFHINTDLFSCGHLGNTYSLACKHSYIVRVGYTFLVGFSSDLCLSAVDVSSHCFCSPFYNTILLF
jgi:hypothetical protein